MFVAESHFLLCITTGASMPFNDCSIALARAQSVKILGSAYLKLKIMANEDKMVATLLLGNWKGHSRSCFDEKTPHFEILKE